MNLILCLTLGIVLVFSGDNEIIKNYKIYIHLVKEWLKLNCDSRLNEPIIIVINAGKKQITFHFTHLGPKNSIVSNKNRSKPRKRKTIFVTGTINTEHSDLRTKLQQRHFLCDFKSNKIIHLIN
jgi:hypothetical protein